MTMQDWYKHRQNNACRLNEVWSGDYHAYRRKTGNYTFYIFGKQAQTSRYMSKIMLYLSYVHS